MMRAACTFAVLDPRMVRYYRIPTQLLVHIVLTFGLPSVRAEEPHTITSCPSPAALYALRAKSPRELVKLLGLPPAPRNEQVDPDIYVGNARWEVALHRVWPPTSGRCHVAVVRAALKERWSSEDGSRENVRETVMATLTLDAAGKPERGRDLSAHDWLAEAEPYLGDVTGDGLPDALPIVERHGQLGYAGGIAGDDYLCTVPRGEEVQIAQRAIQLSGALLTPSDVARATAALERGQFPDCPGDYRPQYKRWDRQGLPFLRATGDVLVLDFVVEERSCRGWQIEGAPSDVSMCTAPRLVHVQTRITKGEVQTVSEPVQAARVESNDPKAKLLAIPWALGDGLSEPHPVAVTIARGEGGSARKQGTAKKPLRLMPGVYLVQRGQGSDVLTYQITVEPGVQRLLLDSAGEGGGQ